MTSQPIAELIAEIEKLASLGADEDTAEHFAFRHRRTTYRTILMNASGRFAISQVTGSPSVSMPKTS